MSRALLRLRHLSSIQTETRVVFNYASINALTPSWYSKTNYQAKSLCYGLCTIRRLHLSRYSYTNFDSAQEHMADNKFAVDYDKRGKAACKKCKQNIGKQALRIAKLTSNHFSDDGGEMKQFFHPRCMFETFVKTRATTKIIDDTDVLEGFDTIEDEDKKEIRRLIDEIVEKKSSTGKKTPSKKISAKEVESRTALSVASSKASTIGDSDAETSKTSVLSESQSVTTASDPEHKDNSFREFRKLCCDIGGESGYIAKTKLVADFIKRGSTGEGYKGEVYLLLKLLLPREDNRVYNLHNKQLVHIFAQIFKADVDEMLEDVNQGDVAETIKTFFEASSGVKPTKKSLLNVLQVDEFLTELSGYTREDDQKRVLRKIASQCTSNDLKMFVRMIKQDLRMNAGAKPILDGLDRDAYSAFQASHNLENVVRRVLQLRISNDAQPPGLSKRLSVRASLMTPVLPMLAEACKSVEQAFKKCPNGMYAEIKYDGERVQVHKRGDTFSYYSRSLKPVMPHKVAEIKSYIGKAFPDAEELILDAEVLLIDTNTGNPLPFGSLGRHKQTQFKDANVCLFIFDCLFYNGDNLMDKPIKTRRDYLNDVMTEIPNRILFSEMTHITKADQLKSLMARVFNDGLEGLVLKDANSTYEPGKRHWLKVKKDYLQEGAMADSADLLVLGAYYGSGSKGGMMSVFLMGCENAATGRFHTVTKCGNGFDDKTLAQLQKQLQPNMREVPKSFQCPPWLRIKSGNVPDFIVEDPKLSPVWEISGAEFTKSDQHTADGISIRFPRVTKVRDDKSWQDATNLEQLQALVKTSRERSDFGERLGATSSSASATDRDVSERKKLKSPRSSKQKIAEVTTAKVKSAEKSVEKRDIKTATKRAASTEGAGEDVSPAKTRRKEKPACRYGVGCYQTSSKHLSTYSHDCSGSSNRSTEDRLPDLFQGMLFHLSDSVSDKRKLWRYIIAHAGDIVRDFEKNSATHIVIASQPIAGTHKMAAVQVPEKWIWDCVRRKKRVPVDDY